MPVVVLEFEIAVRTNIESSWRAFVGAITRLQAVRQARKQNQRAEQQHHRREMCTVCLQRGSGEAWLRRELELPGIALQGSYDDPCGQQA